MPDTQQSRTLCSRVDNGYVYLVGFHETHSRQALPWREYQVPYSEEIRELCFLVYAVGFQYSLCADEMLDRKFDQAG
jgi:hypothetical protein